MESLAGSAQHHTAIVNGTVLISVPALSNVSPSSRVGPGSLCAALMLVALLFPLVPVVVPIPAPHAVCGGCACRLLLARPAPAINDGGPGVVCPGRRGAVTSAFAWRPDRSRCLRGPGVGVIGSPHVLRHSLVYLGRPCARRPGGRRAARPRPPRSRGRSIDQGRLRPGTPRTMWTGGATPAEQHASPAVKTSNPCLPPRDAQGAVGGIRAWGRIWAAGPAHLRPYSHSRRSRIRTAKSLPRTAQHESAEPTARHRARLPPTVTAPQSPSHSRPEYAQPTLTRASRAALVHRNRSDKPTDAGPKLSPRTQQSGLRPSARRAASPPPRRRHERPIFDLPTSLLRNAQK